MANHKHICLGYTNIIPSFLFTSDNLKVEASPSKTLETNNYRCISIPVGRAFHTNPFHRPTRNGGYRQNPSAARSQIQVSLEAVICFVALIQRSLSIDALLDPSVQPASLGEVERFSEIPLKVLNTCHCVFAGISYKSL